MKKKRSRIWWGLLILLLLAIAIFFGYYLGRDNALVEEAALVEEVVEKAKKIPLKIKEVNPVSNSTHGIKERNERNEIEQIEETEPQKVRIAIKGKEPSIGIPAQPLKEDYCAQIESQFSDFFIYLDSRDYIKEMDLKTDSLSLYKKILGELSSNPPIPSGEGLSPEIMNTNIFFLFRILDWEDICFVKEVLKHEADTIEMNMDLFYQFFMSRDQCPDPENLRPTFRILYHYAGFFLNTIGGRACLFRRTSTVRLLMTYYSILVIHEADKTGGNNYGIDICPEIAPLMREISIQPDLRFQNEYISQLTGIKDYYEGKR
ncbi:MAG: hypothetical protein JW882_18615 [Deltaproteobacteria bacterium]|nr:hypothetical protein [Deltaproteobacteria bacterium]